MTVARSADRPAAGYLAVIALQGWCEAEVRCTVPRGRRPSAAAASLAWLRSASLGCGPPQSRPRGSPTCWRWRWRRRAHAAPWERYLTRWRRRGGATRPLAPSFRGCTARAATTACPAAAARTTTSGRRCRRQVRPFHKRCHAYLPLSNPAGQLPSQSASLGTQDNDHSSNFRHSLLCMSLPVTLDGPLTHAGNR